MRKELTVLGQGLLQLRLLLLGSALKALVSSTLLSISFTAATNPHCHILLISH